jgi:ribA/ribD-fused uncharacterized protein
MYVKLLLLKRSKFIKITCKNKRTKLSSKSLKSKIKISELATQEPNHTSFYPNDTGTIFFHSERSLPYGIFSQWYPLEFSDPPFPEITFNTAEQYMMYRKALLFSDPKTAVAVPSTSKPGAQKALGRMVESFDEGVWQEQREKIVEDGNFWKFGGDRGKHKMTSEVWRIREMMMGTGGRLLCEASPSDRIW